MALSSELDVLLATAREISRARQAAHRQIGELEEALTQAREGLKHTNALADQITHRLREIGRRQGLLPPASRAGSLGLLALATLTTQALAAQAAQVRAPNVVALRPSLSEKATADALEPGRTLSAVLCELLATLDEREARVLRLCFGIARREDEAPEARGPQTLMQAAKLMGLRAQDVVRRFEHGLAKLRHPSRADRLRPFLDHGEVRQVATREAELLHAVFRTWRNRE